MDCAAGSETAARTLRARRVRFLEPEDRAWQSGKRLQRPSAWTSTRAGPKGRALKAMACVRQVGAPADDPQGVAETRPLAEPLSKRAACRTTLTGRARSLARRTSSDLHVCLPWSHSTILSSLQKKVPIFLSYILRRKNVIYLEIERCVCWRVKCLKRVRYPNERNVFEKLCAAYGLLVRR